MFCRPRKAKVSSFCYKQAIAKKYDYNTCLKLFLLSGGEKSYDLPMVVAEYAQTSAVSQRRVFSIRIPSPFRGHLDLEKTRRLKTQDS